MRVSFKETIWREFKFDATEEEEQRIMELIRIGKITDSDSLYDFIMDETDIELDVNEHNIETAEPMTPEENGGEPTIEVFENDDDTEPTETN
jgi:hypothetical protein